LTNQPLSDFSNTLVLSRLGTLWTFLLYLSLPEKPLPERPQKRAPDPETNPIISLSITSPLAGRPPEWPPPATVRIANLRRLNDRSVSADLQSDLRGGLDESAQIADIAKSRIKARGYLISLNLKICVKLRIFS
jgi:hypothetical protein